MLSAARSSGAGLDADIEVTFRGSAGQSFGAWLAPGVELTVHGDVNDYAGKGLSGGVIAVRPTGRAGGRRRGRDRGQHDALRRDRAAARSSAGWRASASPCATRGADAVVEGVGDHGCEYMTGGHVVVLGPTGRNFAAGMSGGIAYVLDDDGGFAAPLQPDARRPRRRSATTTRGSCTRCCSSTASGPARAAAPPCSRTSARRRS